MTKAKGAREPGTDWGATRSNGATASTLKDLGITKDKSSQWQRPAAVPQPQFEAVLADQERPTASGIIKANLPSKAKPVSDGALWLWGRLRDFERQGFFDQRPGEILSIQR